MSDINAISITGRLGQDPELSYIGGGETAKTVLRLASSRTYTKAGEKVENTLWIDVICGSKLAEVVKEYCTKGQQIGVSGRLEIDEWQDKEGNKRRSTSIVADNIHFGARPNTGNGKIAIKQALDSIRALVGSGIDIDVALKVVEEKEVG